MAKWERERHGFLPQAARPAFQALAAAGAFVVAGLAQVNSGSFYLHRVKSTEWSEAGRRAGAE